VVITEVGGIKAPFLIHGQAVWVAQAVGIYAQFVIFQVEAVDRAAGRYGSLHGLPFPAAYAVGSKGAGALFIRGLGSAQIESLVVLSRENKMAGGEIVKFRVAIPPGVDKVV